jgi:hypothetical protein
MIVQITLTRNELFLIKEMMPQWQKYADGFVFMLDRCDDGTYEYLIENKDKFNVLSILDSGIDLNNSNTQIESQIRQKLFDEALKYSGNIICLDTDEYLDGTANKDQLESILENNKDTLFHARWIQYTGKNTIRTDGPWKVNFKDRIGSYSKKCAFKNAQMHSEHLPVPTNQAAFEIPHLFIAHLQWLHKPTVAVKQYFWKITDYVVNKKFGTQTIPASAYDASVNNFNWLEEHFSFDLKIDSEVYAKQDIKESFKYKYIKENVKEFNIPNLNDWGMGIHE